MREGERVWREWGKEREHVNVGEIGGRKKENCLKVK